MQCVGPTVTGLSYARTDFCRPRLQFLPANHELLKVAGALLPTIQGWLDQPTVQGWLVQHCAIVPQPPTGRGVSPCLQGTPVHPGCTQSASTVLARLPSSAAVMLSHACSDTVLHPAGTVQCCI